MSAKSMLGIFAASAALTFAAGAQAGPAASNPDVISVRVPLDDLNLDTRAGAAVGLQRISNAARQICGNEGDTRPLDRRALHKDCMRATVNIAVATLDHPNVTALNERRGQQKTVLAANH